LVLGRSSEHFRNTSRKESTGNNSTQIEFLEDVTDTQLAFLYQHAEALVYPSSYEGFGLPPLEALSYNCPSVLTDIPVFNEIYEGAAVFIQDASPQNIAIGIERIRKESGLREKIISKGKDVTERHTFKKVSERMVQRLFEEELGTKKSPTE
jgi:glycosyltransferase involved in cell wall biosynthesis